VPAGGSPAAQAPEAASHVGRAGGAPWILVTNDDGVDSPALPPLLPALASLGRVRAVVPASECSWTAKIMSRFALLTPRLQRRSEAEVWGVDGYPADCANLGIHSLFDCPPALVVSGVNLGTNAGLAFALSSGTVGAALEAALAGVPAVAFSVELRPEDYAEWRRCRVLRDEARELLERGAAVAAEIVAEVLRGGLPGDASLMSVNMPSSLRLDSPRRLAPLTATAYGPYFSRRGDGRFGYHFSGLRICAPAPQGDLAVLARGEVALTPIRLVLDAAISAADRTRFERGGDSVGPAPGGISSP